MSVDRQPARGHNQLLTNFNSCKSRWCATSSANCHSIQSIAKPWQRNLESHGRLYCFSMFQPHVQKQCWPLARAYMHCAMASKGPAEPPSKAFPPGCDRRQISPQGGRTMVGKIQIPGQLEDQRGINCRMNLCVSQPQEGAKGRQL